MRFIRYRLLTIVVIGVIMSALSLGALVRVLSVTSVQRADRAREGVRGEVERLAAVGPGDPRAALAAAPALALVGMRGGYWNGPGAVPQVPPAGTPADPFFGLPSEWRRPLRQALVGSGERHTLVMAEEAIGPATLVIGAQPAGAAGIAWAGVLVSPPHYWNFWLTTVILLALATAFLFTSAMWALVTFKRSANSLHRCLVGLAEDLSTPVPSLHVRELSEVADGIQLLASGLRQAREEQERLGRELSQQERLAALGRVVAGVAHEVRNPLASIKLRLDLAAAGATLAAPVAQAITHASSEIARLDRLVADLLVVSGRHPGPRRQTSLGALVRARVEALSPWAGMRKVSIQVQGDAYAMIEAESVARAVDNLLRNAVEAAPGDSVVQVRIAERSPGDFAVISIEDRGPGVPRSAELFEPFFTTKSDGTGLGLAISRAIARSHGGDVTYARMTSSGGPGGDTTRFELTLERTASAASEVAA